MITIQNIHKSFGKNQVLQGIDLSFDQPGKISAVLGPNGSGKTTLIKCLLGMVLPSQGVITINGQSVKGQWLYRDQMDYLPQIARFPENLTVREIIDLIKDLRNGDAKDEQLIEEFGLAPFHQKKLRNLSGGTRQKVNLTLALMYDRPIIILDEPTSGLDPVAMQTLRRIIKQEKEKGKLILITTHIMSFVEEIADEIVFLLDGKVYFRGSLQHLKSTYNESNVERAIAHILRGEPPFNSNGKKGELDRGSTLISPQTP